MWMENTFCICRCSNNIILFYSIQWFLLVDNMHEVNGALWINNIDAVSQLNRMMSMPMGIDEQYPKGSKSSVYSFPFP